MNRENLKVIFSDKRNIAIAAVGGFLAIGFLVLIFAILLQKPQTKLETISPEEKEEILANVVNNNSQTLFDNKNNFSNNDSDDNVIVTNPNVPSVGQPGSSSLPNPEAVPDLDQYNYRVTTIEYSEGPATTFCKIFSHGCGMVENNEGITTSYEYFDKNRSLYKYVSNDHHEELSSYRLIEYSNIANHMTHYMGGEYAVDFEYTVNPNFTNQKEFQSASEPISYLKGTTRDKVLQYFGSNVEITNIYTRNGREYYEVQFSYTQFCNTSNPYLIIPGIEPAKEETLINVVLIDSKSFDIVQTDTYFRSVAAENLISSRKVSVERSKKSLSVVQSIFDFEYSVPIKSIDYRNSSVDYTLTAQYNRLVNYFLNEQVQLLTFATPYNLEISYINVPDASPSVDGDQYFKDRAFYPADSRGEEMYDNATLHLLNPTPKVNYEFSNRASFNNIYVEVYSNDVGVNELVSKFTDVEATEITVNDVQTSYFEDIIDAKKVYRRFDYVYPVSYLGSGPVSYPTYSYEYENLIFNYGGNTYVITYNPKSVSYQEFTYKLFNFMNVENTSNLEYLIWSALTWHYPYNLSYPVSYSN